jgi:hypothetical protein
VISRASIGAGETFVGVSHIVYLDANSQVAVDYYNASGASTISGTGSFFYIKYLGAG